MRLPALERADIPPAKLRDYLLDPEHPVGGAKTRFFVGLGFEQEHWPLLRAAPLGHAAMGEAREMAKGPFGQKYVVRGTIVRPTGRTAPLLAVWLIAGPVVRPRFITAYPEDP
ncbi:MAG: hypothetical protein SF070_11470 [Gemmatimonadota bacterium]|nr:hypothetical protein [Gemmatimonadota bacterium]